MKKLSIKDIWADQREITMDQTEYGLSSFPGQARVLWDEDCLDNIQLEW